MTAENNDIDRLIGVAKSFREATTDAAPTEGSIIGLWMATASALESTTARLRETEAALNDVRAEAEAWAASPAGESAPCREVGALFTHLSRYKTTKTEGGGVR